MFLSDTLFTVDAQHEASPWGEPIKPPYQAKLPSPDSATEVPDTVHPALREMAELRCIYQNDCNKKVGCIAPPIITAIATFIPTQSIDPGGDHTQAE